MNKRNIINENLIHYSFYLIVFTYALFVFETLFERVVYITIGAYIGYELLLNGYKYYCKRRHIEVNHRINFIASFVVMSVFIVITIYHATMTLLVYSLYSYESQNLELDFTSIAQPLGFILIPLIYLIYALKNYSNDKDYYYRIPFTICILAHTIMIFIVAIILFTNMSPNGFYIAFNIIAYFILLTIMIYPLITLFNLSFNGRFYNKKENVKVFLYNLFKKNLAYFIGVIFSLIVGILYIFVGYDEYFVSLGFIFIIISMLKIFDAVWDLFITKKAKDKLYKHICQYVLIIINVIIIAPISLLIWITFQRTNLMTNSDFGIITIVLALILVLRIIFSVFGFYYTRISKSKEPSYIALNSLSFISLFISAYAFTVHLILSFNKDELMTNDIIFILSIVVLSLIGVVIIETLFRGINGLIKTYRIINK